jgi:NDP-hexose 4-ketoreductase
VTEDAAPVRVVVTGAQGFLGRHVSVAALRSGAAAVLGLGRSRRMRAHFTHSVTWMGEPVAAPLTPELREAEADPRYRYARIDLADADATAACLASFGPDVVIHCAAALRDSSWAALSASNITATVALVEAAALASVPRVVLTSSGSVYGGGHGMLPLREDGPLDPVDLYGISKRCGEDVARVLADRHRMSVVSARVFNLVGPGLQELHLPAVLAGRITEARRTPGRTRLPLGPLHTTRDFVDVRDAAEALALLAGRTDVEAAVNVASGRETPVRRVLELVLALAGHPDVDVTEAAGRPTDIPRAVADIGRLSAHGHKARRSLEDSLGAMVGYYDGLGRS